MNTENKSETVLSPVEEKLVRELVLDGREKDSSLLMKSMKILVTKLLLQNNLRKYLIFLQKWTLKLLIRRKKWIL